MTSNAERQRAYRQRRAGDGERINMHVEVHVKRQLKRQLKRLARHYGATRRAVLARLLRQAERDTTGQLAQADLSSYYEGH